MRNFLSALLLGAFVLVPLTGCDSNDNSDDMNEVVAKTIVETAIDAEFNTLVTAVTAAELVETLSGPGPFTVFAPTDAAFEAVDSATLTSLLQPENRSQLQAVLTYHVIAGRVTSEQVVGLTAATTVQGSDVQIEVVGGTVRINGANVIQADIEASNGIIHVIDQVLLPPSN